MIKNPNPFGLLTFLPWNHDWNNFHFNQETLEKAVHQLKDLGVGMIRMDIIWSDIHSGKFKYNFARYDRLVELLEKNGIQILGLLLYNKKYLDATGKIAWNRPPHEDDFAHYASSVVTRYKNWIKHWEIWNEPNHPFYWDHPKDKLSKYASLLKKSYSAIKSADQQAIVLNGGITEPLLEDVENLYRQAGKDVFDVLSIHTFIDPHLPNRESVFHALVSNVRDIMMKAGDANKKIWITEMGCPGVPNGYAGKWFAGNAVNEEDQARWIEEQYGFLKNHPYVEKIFWAFHRDTPDIFKDATDYLGLVRFDLTPKPAFYRLKQLIASHQS